MEDTGEHAVDTGSCWFCVLPQPPPPDRRFPQHESDTCTGIAQRFGHKKKNHMSWFVSMATRLQIWPAVISPIDRLEVDKCMILL